MWYEGGVVQVGLGGGKTRNCVLQRKLPHHRSKTHVGAKETDDACTHIWEGWPESEPGKDKGDAMQPHIYLGLARWGRIKTAGDGRGIHLQGDEEDMGKLWWIWSNNDGTITMDPQRDNPQEGHYIDPWGGLQRKGGRYVCCVIPTRSEIGRMPGGGMPGKGAQPGQAPQTLHVQVMKYYNNYFAGGALCSSVELGKWW